MKAGVYVIGARELARQLNMKEKEVKEAVQEEIKDTAIAVAAEAQQNIVNNRSVITGTLLRSIRPEVGRLEARVGTNVRYAPFVEFGTYKMKAKPYLLPAFNAKVPGIEDRVRRRLK